MARWRYGGDGWAVSDPIHILGEQLEAVWPERHATDGTIASGAHAKWPKSDHGVDPNGIVRAIDVGVTRDQGPLLVANLAATRDPRIAYFIHLYDADGRPGPWIWRSYQREAWHPAPWTPGRYTGSNVHRDHVHVSMLRDSGVDRDGRPFNIDLGGALLSILQLQQSLNKAGRTDPDGEPLDEDGRWGPNTEHAFVSALTADTDATPPDLSDYATVEWTRDFVNRKTAGVIRKGDAVRLRGVPDDDS